MYCPECGNKCETTRNNDCPIYRCTFCFPDLNDDTSYWVYWDGKYELIHESELAEELAS